MPYVPPQGNTPNTRMSANPTLIPNFDKVSASGQGTFDHQNPAAYLAANPRVDASGTGTVAGTITNGDTVTVKVALATLPNGSATVAYPVVTADTATTVAEGVANAFNNSAVMQAAGLFAEMGGTGLPAQFVVHGSGPIGNFATLTATVSGGATETITFGNGGVLAGGSGPVFATNNFEWAFPSGGVSAFFAGQPYILGFDVLTQMVAQGMPIE